MMTCAQCSYTLILYLIYPCMFIILFQEVGGGGDGEGRQCRAACRLRRVNIAKADKVDACGIGFKIISNFYVREQKISNIISDLCEHSNILNE